MNRVPINIDAGVAALLGDSQEDIERTVLEIIVLELYRRHVISAGWAAEKLGREKFAFIRWSGALGIPFFDMTPEEWQQELRVIRKMAAQSQPPETQGS